jgi:ADP-ribose pyrophosphatase YjhB (NUDIX family)
VGRLRRLAGAVPAYARLAWWGLVSPRLDRTPLVVVQAVVRGERGLLLCVRSDLRGWELPGGEPEAGESPELAVAREVREETGVEVEVGRLIGVYSDPQRQVIAYPGGERVHAVNLCFDAHPVGRGEPTTPEETLETAFFAVDALPEALVPIHRVRIDDAVARADAAAVR